MMIVDLRVELTGTGEVLVNGRHVTHSDAKALVEEKIIFNKVTTDQQWMLMCIVRQLFDKQSSTYMKSRVKAKEITMNDYERSTAVTIGKPVGKNVSAAGGIPGTKIGPLGSSLK